MCRYHFRKFFIFENFQKIFEKINFRKFSSRHAFSNDHDSFCTQRLPPKARYCKHFCTPPVLSSQHIRCTPVLVHNVIQISSFQLSTKQVQFFCTMEVGEELYRKSCFFREAYANDVDDAFNHLSTPTRKSQNSGVFPEVRYNLIIEILT